MVSSNEFKQEVVPYKKKILDFTSNFFKEKTGKGPTGVKVELENNYLYVEIAGYLTKLERNLVTQYESVDIVHALRNECVEVFKDEYLKGISYIINQRVEIASRQRDLKKEKINLKLKIM